MLTRHGENDRPFQAISGPKGDADQILRSVALTPRLEWRGLDSRGGGTMSARRSCATNRYSPPFLVGERIALVPCGVLMAPTKGGDRQVTPDPELPLLVSRRRARAQEILAQAETMRDAEARQTMQEIAARYERLALRVEQRTCRADKVQATSGSRHEPGETDGVCARERVIGGQKSLTHV